MNNPSNQETGCCPKFDPQPWEEKVITFKEKLFLKDHINSIFHLPLNFGEVMRRNMGKIEKADAVSAEQLVITDEKSLWGADVFIAVDKEVPQADMKKISGTFLTKVFVGPYKNMGRYIKAMKAYVKSQNKKLEKLYFYYTYCPKCAKTYGKNYTVILAQV